MGALCRWFTLCVCLGAGLVACGGVSAPGGTGNGAPKGPTNPAAPPPTFEISGQVDGAAGQRVTLLLSGAANVSQQADSNGAFHFSGLANGNYTVTPSLTGFTFAPASVAVTLDGKSIVGLRFAAGPTLQTFRIEGSAGIAGVTMSLSGASSVSISGDVSGAYVFSGLAKGTYVVTPSKVGFTFSPAKITVTLDGADVTGQNFSATASPETFSISGTLTGPAIAGVVVSLSGNSTASATTDAKGHYVFSGLRGGTYFVIPSKTGIAFTPRASSVILPGFGSSEVNFTGAVSSTTPLWSGVQSPTPQNLYAISGSADDDVWAVGAQGTVVTFRGDRWFSMPSGSTAQLTGVWVSPSHQVWAVGQGALLHFDGSSFKSVSTGTSNSLAAVWGSADDDIWAVGGNDSEILHWDGTQWTSMTTDPIEALSAVWGRAANDVWATGGGVVFHWDGISWSVSSTVAVGSYAVWGSRADDVWVVSVGSFEHFNGVDWNRQSFDNPFLGIWGSAGDDIWAVGANFGQGPVAHWDGHTWSSVPISATPAVDVTLFGIWGSSPHDVWAVGSQGQILHYGATIDPVAKSTPSASMWPGWSDLAQPFSWFPWIGDDGAITEQSSNALWVGTTLEADYSPLLVRWNGQAWATEPVGGVGYVSSELIDSAAEPVVALSYTPYDQEGQVTVLRWNGSGWSQLGAGFDIGMRGMHTGDIGDTALAQDASGNLVLAVDINERVQVFRWGKGTWTSIGDALPMGGNDLQLVVDSSGALVVAGYEFESGGNIGCVGEQSLQVYRWDGRAWQSLGGNLAVEATGDSPCVAEPLGGFAIAAAPAGLTLAWTEFQSWSSDSGRVVLNRWNGSAWQQLGASAMVTSPSKPSLAIDRNGKTVLAWSEGRGALVQLQRWSGADAQELAALKSPDDRPLSARIVGFDADDPARPLVSIEVGASMYHFERPHELHLISPSAR